MFPVPGLPIILVAAPASSVAIPVARSCAFCKYEVFSPHALPVVIPRESPRDSAVLKIALPLGTSCSNPCTPVRAPMPPATTAGPTVARSSLVSIIAQCAAGYHLRINPVTTREVSAAVGPRAIAPERALPAFPRAPKTRSGPIAAAAAIPPRAMLAPGCPCPARIAARILPAPPP